MAHTTYTQKNRLKLHTAPTAQTIRTMEGSIPKNSATPPHTPLIIRSRPSVRYSLFSMEVLPFCLQFRFVPLGYHIGLKTAYTKD